jgi:3-isopropylmalate/(R)-2-methylmalate dehydratase small subunit
MKSLVTHKGKVALLNRADVDTDQIIPKQFLKKIGRTGFGDDLFFDWRYLDNGEPNPDFELNQPEFKGASILLAGDNFGCGSSREHAPWALLEYGFRVIVSSSFADIFYSNCLKNGILPIYFSKEIIKNLMGQFASGGEVFYEVDLPNQVLIDHEGNKISFEVDAFRKDFLLKGLDDIAWSLQYEKDISEFEQKQRQNQSWLWR